MPSSLELINDAFTRFVGSQMGAPQPSQTAPAMQSFQAPPPPPQTGTVVPNLFQYLGQNPIAPPTPTPQAPPAYQQTEGPIRPSGLPAQIPQPAAQPTNPTANSAVLGQINMNPALQQILVRDSGFSRAMQSSLDPELQRQAQSIAEGLHFGSSSVNPRTLQDLLDSLRGMEPAQVVEAINALFNPPSTPARQPRIQAGATRGRAPS